MNPNLLLLLPLLAPGGSKQNLKEFSSRLLPMIIPGPPSQRLAFAAIVVDQQVKRQERQQVEIAKEVVKAGGFKDLTELQTAAPTVGKLIAGLGPAAQAAVFDSIKPAKKT